MRYNSVWSTRPGERSLRRDLPPAPRLDARVGYGMGLASAEGVVTPYMGLSLDERSPWRHDADWRWHTHARLGLETVDAERVTLRLALAF